MWDRVDFDNEIILISRTFSGNVLRDTTKTKTWRPLPMTVKIYDIIKSQKGRSSSFFVFTNPDNNNKPYSKDINDIWRVARKKAGISITLYKGTRHSYLTQKAKLGHDLHKLQAIAGHTLTRTTKKYIKMYTDALRSVMESDVKDFHSVRKPSKVKN